jgi:Transglutaminase-like superfamily
MSELQRRLQLARRHIASPSDAVLLARMAGWAAALPLLKYVMPLQRLVRLLAAGGDGERAPAREQKVADLARVLYRSPAAVVRDNCLERSLVAYRYLSRANANPELVVAMTGEGSALLGHVWVTIDGEPLYDSPEQLAEFVPMVVFDASGKIADYKTQQ